MKLKIKRRAMSVLIHQAAWMVDHGRMLLFNIMRIQNAEGSERHNPLRGCLTDQEYKLIRQRFRVLKELVEDLRKIANHLERSSRDE